MIIREIINEELQLESGDIVELSCGAVYLVIDGVLINDTGCVTLAGFDENLRHLHFVKCDVTKVYSTKSWGLGTNILKAISTGEYTPDIVWERTDMPKVRYTLTKGGE